MNQCSYFVKFAIIVILAVALTPVTANALAQSGRRVWSFDQDPIGKMPSGFTSALTGRGTIGRW